MGNSISTRSGLKNLKELKVWETIFNVYNKCRIDFYKIEKLKIKGREMKEERREESRHVNNMKLWQLWDNVFKLKHLETMVTNYNS